MFKLFLIMHQSRGSVKFIQVIKISNIELAQFCCRLNFFVHVKDV